MRRAQQGFHLLELMCCLAVLAIFMCLALPLGQTQFQKAQLNRVTKEIQDAINYARQLAYINEQTLSLFPLQANNWSAGMQLKASRQPGNERVLYEWKWDRFGLRVIWVGFQGRSQIDFSPSPSHSAENGYFEITSGSMKRKLVLNRLGHLRVET